METGFHIWVDFVSFCDYYYSAFSKSKNLV